MTTPNEELRARLLAAADAKWAHEEAKLGPDEVLHKIGIVDLLREAAAALARQEEGREAVAWRVPTPYGVGYNFASEAVMKDMSDWLNPAPPSAGEGDAATLMEGWHSAINDADEIFANADTSKRDAIRNRASRVVNWLKAHPPVATPTPQSGGAGEAEEATCEWCGYPRSMNSLAHDPACRVRTHPESEVAKREMKLAATPATQPSRRCHECCGSLCECPSGMSPAPASPQAAGDLPFATVQAVVNALTRHGWSTPCSQEEQAARANELVRDLCTAVQEHFDRLTTAGQQAAGVSDAYRELMEVRAGLCTLDVMGPGETAAEALQRYVTRCTAAGAAQEPAGGGDVDWMRSQLKALAKQASDDDMREKLHGLAAAITNPSRPYLATPTPQAAGDAGVCWFIEDPKGPERWWDGGTRFNLTNDPHKAVRFPSRASAERFIGVHGATWADCIATEHMFISRGQQAAGVSDAVLARDRLWCESAVYAFDSSGRRLMIDAEKMLGYFNSHRPDSEAAPLTDLAAGAAPEGWQAALVNEWESAAKDLRKDGLYRCCAGTYEHCAAWLKAANAGEVR